MWLVILLHMVKKKSVRWYIHIILCMLTTVYCEIDPFFLSFDCHQCVFKTNSKCTIEQKCTVIRVKLHTHALTFICSKYHNLFWLLSCGDSHSLRASITFRFIRCCIWGLFQQHRLSNYTQFSSSFRMMHISCLSWPIRSCSDHLS